MSHSQWILLIRHGARRDRQGPGSARQWAEEAEAGHIHDPPLSEEGLLQAQRTASFVSHLCRCTGARNIEVVSSPLRRCVQTAVAIVEGLRQQLPEEHGRVLKDEAQQAAQIPLSIDSGLFELFTEELFPVKPSHAVSPFIAQDQSSSLAAVVDSCSILDQWPESKTQSTARTLDFLNRRISLVPDSVLVLVAHQFNCKVITSKFMSAYRFSKGIKNWKDAAREKLLATRRERSYDVFPESLLLLPPSSSTNALEFDVCSVSLFEWIRDGETDQGKVENSVPSSFPSSAPSSLRPPDYVHFLSHTGHLSETCRED